jgi:ATP-binding cassette subfamily B protein
VASQATPGGRGLSDEADNSTGALRSVFRFLRPYYQDRRMSLALLAFCTLAETGYNVAFPLSLKFLIDDVLLKRDKAALVWILIVLSALAILISGAGALMEHVNAQLAAAVMRNIRHRLFAHLQSLSPDYGSGASTGGILSHFSTDLAELEQAVRYWAGSLLAPVLELLAAVVLLFRLSPYLAAAAMLIWPLTMAGPRIFAPRALAAACRKKELEAAALSVIQESAAAQPVIHAFGLRNFARAWFRNRNVPLERVSSRVNFFSGMSDRSVSMAVLLLHVAIIGTGALLAFDSRISIGTLVTFEGVFWELSYNIERVSQFFPVVVGAAGGIGHINELLARQPTVTDKPDAGTLPRLRHEIAFENVTFAFGAERSPLKNMNLRIPCGCTVGLIGPSGSGKSTLLNLMLRLYDPTSGCIRIDGRDIRHFRRESLCAQIGVVFQESFLFNLSIRENIRLGKQDATDDEVRAAARAAEIHDFILSLPQGYATSVGERGALLSGGQRQRIAIARAIIRDPAILILDEATSALDPITERAVLSTLRRLSAGRTTIFATHRETAMADADLLFLMQDGAVVELQRARQC